MIDFRDRRADHDRPLPAAPSPPCVTVPNQVWAIDCHECSKCGTRRQWIRRLSADLGSSPCLTSGEPVRHSIAHTWCNVPMSSLAVSSRNFSAGTKETALALDTSRAPTLRDVARLAGVHPATASRALNGTRTVNPQLTRQIRKAAETLGYRVNPVGRALKKRTTGVIGMVVPDLTNPFFPALVRAVESALAAESRALFLCESGDDLEVERDRVEALINRQVDGLIISTVHATLSRETLAAAARRVPLVQVDRLVDGVATDAVVADQKQMTRDLIAHLRDHGVATFAMITSCQEISPILERTDAYRGAVPDAGSRDRILRGDLSIGWGAEATRQLLDGAEPLPDAIVCANDLIAAGASGVLRATGIDIPDQIRIVGFDNTTVALAMVPRLTTVQQPIAQMGQDALRLLSQRMADGSGPTRRLTLGGSLIVGESG